MRTCLKDVGAICHKSEERVTAAHGHTACHRLGPRGPIAELTTLSDEPEETRGLQSSNSVNLERMSCGSSMFHATIYIDEPSNQLLNLRHESIFFR